MTKDEYLEKLKEIGTCEDDVQRRTLLAEITDEITNIFDDHDKLSEANKKYETDNEKLREANMKLFLQVGGGKTDQETKKDQTGIDQKEQEKRKFEDLFDEKGGLK